MDDLGEGFGLTAQVPVSIDAKRVCEFMRRALEGLVEALETAPGTAMHALEVLPEEERQKVLYEWNDTAVEYPREKCIQELFEEQVEKSPEAVAVVYEDKQLTYRELNRASEPAGALFEGVGGAAGCASRDLRGAECGDGGGVVGDFEGGRGVCAIGSGVSGGATEVHAGRQRSGGVVDARASAGTFSVRSTQACQ